jgi:uncharacterized protein YqeY
MQDLKEAMKNKDKLKKSVVTMLRSEIKQIEVDERIEVGEERIMDIIASQIKTKRKAIEGFAEGGREDLVEEAEKEIEYLQEYLPKQLTDDELKAIIMETIETVGASSMKDMGKVMGIVNPKVKGRAESAKVAAIVKDELM